MDSEEPSVCLQSFDKEQISLCMWQMNLKFNLVHITATKKPKTNQINVNKLLNFSLLLEENYGVRRPASS